MSWFLPFFPRWNFYDRVSHDIFLEFKPIGVDRWIDVSFEATREPFGLFLNPHVTALHAEKTLLEGFVNSVATTTLASPDPALLKMVTALARASAEAKGFGGSESIIFRVGVESNGQRDVVLEASA